MWQLIRKQSVYQWSKFPVCKDICIELLPMDSYFPCLLWFFFFKAAKIKSHFDMLVKFEEQLVLQFIGVGYM